MERSAPGKLQAHFGDHLVFVGIQGSRARGEACDESDIDFVAIFEMLDANIIRQYREIVATMEQSDLACGFISSRAALAAWPRHELFQFVNDTKALHGSLLDIVETPTKNEARQAAAIGAASLYHAACHLCAFGSMQSPDSDYDATKALFKNAVFAMQAHCFAQGSNYPRSRTELERILENRGWNEEYDILRIGRDEEALRAHSVNKLCDMIISWSERIMTTYTESPQELVIRKERKTDYEQVEKLIREAFNNHYVPGCFEHYLVRLMRSHEDFLPELDLVAEKGGMVVGSIMYTKATLTDGSGKVKNILTFGPIAIHPHHQRKGYGKALMEKSFERARELGYDTIVILGNPANYVGSGFVSCKKHNVHMEDGSFALMEKSFERARELGYDTIVILGNPANYVGSGFVSCKKHNVHMEDGSFSAALLVKELVKGALEANHWTYRYSSVMDIDEGGGAALRRYAGPPRKKMAAEPGGVLHPRKRILVNGIGRGRNSRGRFIRLYRTKAL